MLKFIILGVISLTIISAVLTMIIDAIEYMKKVKNLHN